MATKKKETYITDAGVVEKKDVIGKIFIAMSNITIAVLIILAILAFIAIEVD